MKPLFEEIEAVRNYLERALLPEAEGDLAVDRLAILGQLSPPELRGDAARWASLLSQFQWFQARYGPRYTTHHRRYHHQMAELQTLLEGAQTPVKTLERLNRITELGRPVGEELSAVFQRLSQNVQPCPHTNQEDAFLTQTPVCPACQITLASEPPHIHVQQFMAKVERSLGRQLRRLSSEAIRRILSRGGQDRLDQFIQIVQASDLAGLAETLDDDLVEFIRTLRERFPSVEEEQIEQVVAEFAHQVQYAFQAAKRLRPGKRVRLKL